MGVWRRCERRRCEKRDGVGMRPGLGMGLEMGQGQGKDKGRRKAYAGARGD